MVVVFVVVAVFVAVLVVVVAGFRCFKFARQRRASPPEIQQQPTNQPSKIVSR